MSLRLDEYLHTVDSHGTVIGSANKTPKKKKKNFENIKIKIKIKKRKKKRKSTNKRNLNKQQADND